MLKIKQSRDHLIFNMGIPIPRKDGFYPSAHRAGGVLSSLSGAGGRVGGRSGGRLPNLRTPYLCKRLKDFLNSKFCGIV